MITPSKFTPLDSSILASSIVILENLQFEKNILDLYVEVKAHFDSPYEFLAAVDVLWIMRKIEMNFETGYISNAS